MRFKKVYHFSSGFSISKELVYDGFKDDFRWFVYDCNNDFICSCATYDNARTKVIELVKKERG